MWHNDLMIHIDDLYKEVEKHFARYHHVAHGMDHAVRVAKLAKHIAGREKYDPVEAEIAGLLHDMGRAVQEEEKGHAQAGVPLAGQLLDEFTDYDKATKERILAAVRDHSEFKAYGALTHIVQDADKLDGLGAIGAIRAYTSKAHLPVYDPNNIVPTKGERGTNIHAQIAWQLEFLDMMETKTGRELAQKRGAIMTDFMRQVAREVNGEDF